MRLLILLFVLILALIIAIGEAGDITGAPEGPDPFADGVANAAGGIITPQNAIGAPDETYAELRGVDGQTLLLDMGAGEDGTGNLELTYQVAQDTWIVLEFIGEAENGTLLTLERKEVLLQAGMQSTLVLYDASPTPYRYVRLSVVGGKCQIDAVMAETHLPDSEGDGLPDDWERKFGLDPLLATGLDGPNSDRDGDSLNNKEEYENNTDPTNADTDGDGLLDGWEINNELQPLMAQGQDGADGDPDHDMVPNFLEYANRSNPHDSDTDRDGLPDYWEISHCLNPDDPNGENGPDGDPDQDAISNFVEMGANQFPTIGCISPSL